MPRAKQNNYPKTITFRVTEEVYDKIKEKAGDKTIGEHVRIMISENLECQSKK